LGSYYLKLIGNYPIISIEDGFDQDDWGGFQALLTAVKGRGVQLVGYEEKKTFVFFSKIFFSRLK
jgi:enolase